MKTPKLLLAVFACVTVGPAIAGLVPTHEAYVMPFTEGKEKKFSTYFANWDETNPQPFSEDENFYISRVPMKKRIVNTATQVDPSMTQDRKLCLFTPMGISEKYWQSLPRYVFDGDNFNMWSYVDSQGGWSLPWVRVPGAYSDVTHRNGVANSGGLIFFDSWGGDNTEPQAVVKLLTTKKSSTTFKYTEKFVKFLRYYGVDGVSFNPEGTVPNASALQDFFSACRTYAESIGWRFYVYWYGANSNGGTLDLGSELTTAKSNWFYKNGKQVVNMYMLNYGADGSTSVNTVKSVGGSTYDVYVGYDIQANWLQGRANWTTAVKNKPLSICLWGNHNTNMIYQNSSEFGSGEEAVQERYLSMQEQVFSGGNQNPAKRPAISNNVTTSGFEAMKKFHGFAEYMPARSTMCELPFVTRFGLGNGKAFYNEGKITFNSKWFNVGVQDYLPTWRWWITDNNKNVPSDPIQCSFTFDDAWFAGSAMTVKGATKVSNVRLFKTEFSVASTDAISLTYKLNRGDSPCMELFWAFKGSESTLHYATISSTKKGEWVTFSKKASEIGMTGNVALIGLRFTNTPSYYDAYIGEFSIIPSKSFSPIKPVITTAEANILKKRTYQGLDFKFSWNVTPKTSHPSYSDKSRPVYNEEVDTWYYEVYVQAEGEDPILCGTTSQWAHYLVNAPVSADKNVTDYRVGVCAVAPDGKTKSQITWTNYLSKAITLVDGIARDKDVIKTGDQFTLSLLDPNQSVPKSWTIINAQSGASEKTQSGGRTFTTSLSNEGYYDIIVEKTDGNKSYYRAFIQISPTATGKVPTIQSIASSKQKVFLGESNEVTLSYAGNNNEGTVSRGLELLDPYMFRIPKEYLPQSVSSYSIGLWIKPSKFTYANFGMSLINKRSFEREWPNNNWGAIWVDVWPEKYFASGKKASDPHIVSFTMFGNEATDPYPSMGADQNTNKHEIPNLQCSSNFNTTKSISHSFVENVWSHILISYDGSKQRIYFNGMKVGEKSARKNSYDESNIYIGGSRVYYSGFNGYIDDVQVWHKALSDDEVKEAMMGYWGKDIPSDLKGYWTFEDVDYDASTKTFKNRGKLSASTKAAYIETKGTGGEDTAGATQEVLLPANIDVTGNPAMSGTLPITTTATFEVGDVTANANTSSKSTKVELDKAGTYDLKLTLSNGWGAATLVNPQYIVVTAGTGVEENVVENMSVYPNPFIDHVNLMFAQDGNYTVDLYDAQGRQLLSKKHQARVNEVFTLEIDAAQGLYYVVVSKDGKRTNTFKVVAQ